MPGVLLALLVGFATCQVALYLTTVYLHRALSHRAITLSPAAVAVCRVLTWVMTGIRPRQWVAVHRKHHAHTDEAGDPHSPVLLGYARVQWGNVGLYRKVARDGVTVTRYARDLPADRADRLLFDHALLGLGLGIGLLVLALGWQLALIAAAVHTVLYLLGGAAVNAIGHHWGKRPADNFATNNQWLAWLVAGEGLHNNHHARATASRFAFRPGEFDPAWWVVRLLARLHLATLRQPVPRASDEPEAATASVA